MSSFDTYFGGKSGSGTYQTIINQIPPHKHYVEGFAGMAGIFRKMNTLATCLLMEIDPFLLSTYLDSGFRRTNSMYAYFQKRHDLNRMVINGDSIKLLGNNRERLDNSDTFIYLDPPYPIDSRKSGPRYKYEMTDRQHEQLLWIIANEYDYASIAISTYPNKLYNNILRSHNWRLVEFESQTRRGKATEQLWMNYPEPTELHDYQYLGDDYRERERIARMQRRWKAKFTQLPDREKKAMLQHLQNCSGS